MKVIVVAFLIVGSGCLTVEVAPPAESFGLLPGSSAVYNAVSERAGNLATSYEFQFDASRVYDRYGNAIDGWVVTVTNDDGFDFPLPWYFTSSHADDESVSVTWWLDGCGEPLARLEGDLTRWSVLDASEVPPMVAASLAEPIHDLELVVAGHLWTVDNRAQPPETVIEGTLSSVSVAHERGEVTVGSGTAPPCNADAPPMPTLINTTTAWDGFEPGLEPKLSDALAAAKTSPAAQNAATYFQNHPTATAQRLWHDPDGGVLGGSGGAWNILWSDGASDVLVSKCARGGQSVPGVLDDLVCTDTTETWGEPAMAPASFDIVDPAQVIPRALAVHGVASCDFMWLWNDGTPPRWELFACTQPYAQDLHSDDTSPWFRIHASTGEFVYRFA